MESPAEAFGQSLAQGQGWSPILAPRRLTTADLKACCELDRLALGALWSPLQWQLELDDPDRLCLGIDQGGCGSPSPPILAALATASVILDELHVSAVAVHPERRRRGLARQVMGALLGEARSRGCHRVTLEVSEANLAARALYGALGFRTAGRRRSYYRNGDDALIEWLEIGS